MIIASDANAESKRRWQVIRRDMMTIVPGEIDSADEESGDCCMLIGVGENKEKKEMAFGPDGIRLVRK